MALEQLDIYMQNDKVKSISSNIHKITLKYIIGLNIKLKVKKFLEKILEENLCNLVLTFLVTATKSLSTMKKCSDELDFLELRT